VKGITVKILPTVFALLVTFGSAATAAQLLPSASVAPAGRLTLVDATTYSQSPWSGRAGSVRPCGRGSAVVRNSSACGRWRGTGQWAKSHAMQQRFTARGAFATQIRRR